MHSLAVIQNVGVGRLASRDLIYQPSDFTTADRLPAFGGVTDLPGHGGRPIRYDDERFHVRQPFRSGEPIMRLPTPGAR